MVTVVGCTAPAIESIRRLIFFNFFMCGRWVLVSATAVMQLGLESCRRRSPPLLYVAVTRSWCKGGVVSDDQIRGAKVWSVTALVIALT